MTAVAEADSPPAPPSATFARIVSQLGRPFYEQGEVALFHADCLEALRALKNGCVHLTVTSPPYNIGKEYEGRQPLEQYLEWCGQWATEVARVTSAEGSFWLNLGYTTLHPGAKALPLSYLMWSRVPMQFIQEIVWHYGAGVASRRSFSPRNEKWLWFVNDPHAYFFDLEAVRDPEVKYPKQKKNGKLKCNPAGKNPTDVWSIPKVTSGAQRSSPERTPHPAQFPLAVIRRIVNATAAPGGVVMDPFVGSGTSAIVAQATGHPFIGFEIDQKYLQLAARRLERHRAGGTQLSLLRPKGD